MEIIIVSVEILNRGEIRSSSIAFRTEERRDSISKPIIVFKSMIDEILDIAIRDIF